MKILYITHVDMQDMQSGSSVRPVKMLEAFKELGWQVDLISGFSNPANFKARGKTLKHWISKIKNQPAKAYEFCYIEPPAGPMLHPLDLSLIKLLHKKGIPTALFYRDAYWKLANWYGRREALPKMWLIKSIQRFEWGLFQKHCTILYGPTQSFCEAVKAKRELKPLPPAGAKRAQTASSKPDKRRVIYAGQATEESGVPLLIKAMELVNREINAELELVCRKAEFESLDIKPAPWLHVHHISGRELEALYLSCDVAVIPRKYDYYMSIAMPVKLPEYISYGLPVVAVDVLETKKFIEKYNIGIVCTEQAESLAQAIIKMYSDEQQYKEYHQNALNALESENLWVHRAEQIWQDVLAFNA
ncbi:MAG: glycosyltransferase [Oscillospiraceae bacterium]|nr:glycosyltransferase [Oscillospiraceae bacterium]